MSDVMLFFKNYYVNFLIIFNKINYVLYGISYIV